MRATVWELWHFLVWASAYEAKSTPPRHSGPVGPIWTSEVSKRNRIIFPTIVGEGPLPWVAPFGLDDPLKKGAEAENRVFWPRIKNGREIFTSYEITNLCHI